VSAPIAWHYTTGDLLARILSDGAIVPATEGLAIDDETIAALKDIVATGKAREMRVTHTEAPAVWFSVRETWEPTATKGFVDGTTGLIRASTIDEMMRIGKGLARVGVPVAGAGLHTWLEHRTMSGIRAAVARSLVLSARGMGSNPGDWRVHYGPVLRAAWIAVQRFDGREWVNVEFETATKGEA
jgi:hypothetical protein